MHPYFSFRIYRIPLCRLLCLWATVQLSSAAAAQPRDAVYLQLGGNGILASADYERTWSPSLPLRFHAGAGIYGLRQSVLTVPVGLRYGWSLPEGGTCIDFGLGLTWTSADPELYTNVKHPEGYVPHGGWNLVPSIGYRRSISRIWFYRVGLAPVVNRYGLLPLLEFSFGKVLSDWADKK
jgi:hypothetical protein